MTNKDLTQGGNFSILPAHIRHNKDLTDSEKIMYSEITALSNKNGYCYASNKYLSELYGVSIDTISRRINNLKKKGFVKVQLIKEKGGNIKERRIYPYVDLRTGIRKPEDMGIRKVADEGIRKVADKGIRKNAEVNNTSINNININNTRENSSQRDKDLEYLVQRYQEIGYGSLTPSAYMTFEKLLDKGFTAEAIERAYQIASDVNRKHQAYINGILRKWEEAGIKTVEQIEEQEIKFREKAEVKKKVYDPLAKWRDEDEEVEYIENENDPLAKWR